MASGILFIETRDAVLTYFQITDLNGKILFEKQTGKNRESIDFKALPSGIYVLKIR
jgi:hypothetical protein